MFCVTGADIEMQPVWNLQAVFYIKIMCDEDDNKNYNISAMGMKILNVLPVKKFI